MNTTPQHILAKEGILPSFSIAKKITALDIKRIKEKLITKFGKVNTSKLQSLLKEAIIKETQTAMETQKIPGLIVDTPEENEEKKRILELTYFASIIAKKLADKKINKYYSCYIINAVVNMLQLSEEDFENFHRKFSEFQNGDKEDE